MNKKTLQILADADNKLLDAEKSFLKTLPYDDGSVITRHSGKYYDFGGVMSGISSIAKSVLDDSLDTTYDDLKRQKEYNNRSVLSGVSDNNALMMAMDNLQWGQKYTDKDFRDVSVWDDVSDTIMGGLSGAMATKSPWGLLAALPVAGNKIANRLRARKERIKGNDDLTAFNSRLSNMLSTTAQNVDAINDRRLLESFYNSAAFGGDLNTHGADWNNGLTYINAGGTHESNPYDGVPAGTDENGVPNLVEEGEVIWDNQYVFSNRLKVPKKLLDKYKLGGSLTYADAIKKVTKESEERKNDPISNATTKAIVNEFIDSQEEVRMKKQQRAAAKVQQAQLEADLLNALAGLGGEEQPLAPMDMQAPVQQAPQEAPVIEQVGAYGGNLFAEGGMKDRRYRREYEEATGSSSYDHEDRYRRWLKVTYPDYYDKHFEDFRDENGVNTPIPKVSRGESNGLKDRKYRREFEKIIGSKAHSYDDIYHRWLKVTHPEFYNEHFEDSYDENGKMIPVPKENKKENTPKENVVTKASEPVSNIKPGTTGTPVEGYEGVYDTGAGSYYDSNTGAYYSSLNEINTIRNPFDATLSPSIITDTIKKEQKIDNVLTGTKDIAELNATTEDEVIPFEYKSTWGRNAPIYGALAGALYGLAGSPNYHNADKILEAAEQIGTPVSVPVETIGDYMQRRPFDERYLVNMANQNRAAASRSAANTAGGNRAMQLGADAFLAHSNQQELGEIMRQAYLANRQDEFNTAEFNRGTNLQNMSAINQRNLSQAQLNSQRQQAMLSGLERGYSLRQQIKSDWDSATQQSLNSLYESLGNKGKEAEEYNTMVSMAEHGYSPYYYGNNGVIQFTPQGQYTTQPIEFWQPNGNLDFSVDYLGWKPRALGGNKKKRRF